MDNDKRFQTQDWDTDAVHQRIINEVEAASAPTPKKKHRKGKFNWKIYVAAVVLGSMLLAGIGWILANDLCALDKGDETYTVTIEEGDGVFKIASKLKKAGLIELKGFFVLYEIFTGAKNDIDPGTYELNTSMDYRSLVHNMYDPDARRRAEEGLVLVTIPEGYSVQQIVDLLAEKGIATKEELVDAVSNFDFGEEYPFIDNSLTGQINRLEGYLFPDTYQFYMSDDPANVIDKFLRNFDNKFTDDLYDALDALNDRLAQRMRTNGFTETEITDGRLSLYDLITVASLVEKETAKTSESASIASVIYNRLCSKLYPCLEIDATIQYALAERKEVLSNADKGVISPYNTYTNAGLPAGPIANPGMNSIRAALYPAETNYYFYALNADGVHHFSETYYEHQNFLAELAGKTQPDEEQTDAPADGEENTDTENQTDGQT